MLELFSNLTLSKGEKEMRYKFQEVAMSNQLLVHIDKRIFRDISYFIEQDDGVKIKKDGYDGWMGDERNDSREKEVNLNLIQDLLGIDGVEKIILVGTYAFFIEKGEVFDWREIISPILYFLHEYLAEEGEELVEVSNTYRPVRSQNQNLTIQERPGGFFTINS